MVCHTLRSSLYALQSLSCILLYGIVNVTRNVKQTENATPVRIQSYCNKIKKDNNVIT